MQMRSEAVHRERRGRGAAAKAVLRYESTRQRLCGLLQRRGWQARQQRVDETTGLHDSGVQVLVVGQGAEADRALLEAETRRQDGGQTVVLLLDSDSEAHLRWAAQITPFCYPKRLPAESLASLLERVRETRAERRRRAAEPADPHRQVCLRLGESVEIDGLPLRLGVAERNFLFELAHRRDHRIAKDSPIESGPGKLVFARECRRRLGRRLGEELAALLVPIERGEPYRLRSAEEVQRCCERSPGRHPPTRLRIVGRSEVGLRFVEDVERLPRD